VGVVDLARWNAIDQAAKVIPGMILQAFVAEDFDESRVVLLDPEKVRLMTAGSGAFLDEYEERNGRKRLIYTVRRGDTLAAIGRRFGLSVGSLARINRFDRRTKLKVGQQIVVYVSKKKMKPARRRKRRKR
jgi:LysM repeat protein